jgi:hypothetical protein
MFHSVDNTMLKILRRPEIESKFRERLCSCRIIGASVRGQRAPYSRLGGR